MGGGVAQQIAIRHPGVVRRLIITSSVYKYEGWSPETRAILPMLTPEMFEPTPIKQEYDKLAPDPKHWKEFINKMKKFVTTSYDFGADKIKAIRSPTLIITGDGDGVLPEHAVEMYRLRGGAYMVDFGPIHAAEGVPKENIQMVVILRKMATYAVFDNELYKEKFKCDNPNLQLLKELMQAGVEFYVCGQTMQKRNIDTKKLVAGTRVASSGLTAITTYQLKGYTMIKF